MKSFRSSDVRTSTSPHTDGALVLLRARVSSVLLQESSGSEFHRSTVVGYGGVGVWVSCKVCISPVDSERVLLSSDPRSPCVLGVGLLSLLLGLLFARCCGRKNGLPISRGQIPLIKGGLD